MWTSMFHKMEDLRCERDDCPEPSVGLHWLLKTVQIKMFIEMSWLAKFSDFLSVQFKLNAHPHHILQRLNLDAHFIGSVAETSQIQFK